MSPPRQKGDSLGDRMKAFYEDRTRYVLPRRTYTIIRVDGKAFHTYTRGMARPFDAGFMASMDATALGMCEETQNARMAYVQSDEISLVLADFAELNTDAWFDGNVQKMASVASSIATAVFAENSTMLRGQFPRFDGRVFTIPSAVEVENYLIWRQQDATRNSIQMAAQAQFSHKDMHQLNTKMLQEKLFQERGINWNDYPTGFRRGRCIVRAESGWDVDTAPPIFTADRAYLSCITPPPPSETPDR